MKLARKWIVWGLTILFLFYEFFLRVFPSVMVPNLMRSFSINAAAVGTLSAWYFFAYAPMQIPVGILMDRYGARKLITLATLICGVGCFLFGFAYFYGFAAAGRFLIGIGSAFAFVGMIYVCSHWFKREKLALLIGIGNSLGMLGAVGGEGPLSYAVEFFGWRPTVITLGIIALGLAILFFLFIRNEPEAVTHRVDLGKETVNLFKNLKIICLNYQTWLNAITALLFYGTTAAFAGLWGISFLQSAHQVSLATASFAVSMIFVGWIVGGPIIGFISDKQGNRKPLLFISTLLACASIIPVIYISELSAFLIFLLLFFVGLFSSAQLLNFSLAIELNPHEAKGTAIALTNFVIAIGSALLQPLVGIFLDWGWSGKVIGNVPFYSVADYRWALLCFPLMLLLSFVLLFFIREKKHKNRV